MLNILLNSQADSSELHDMVDLVQNLSNRTTPVNVEVLLALFSNMASGALERPSIVSRCKENIKDLSPINALDILESLDYSTTISCDAIVSRRKIVWASLIFAALKSWTIRECQLCGNYFVPKNRTDEKYCHSPNPKYGMNLCKEICATVLRKQWHSENVPSVINKRISDRLRNRDILQYRKYKEEWKTKKAKLKNGKISENDFFQWLIEQDNKSRIRK